MLSCMQLQCPAFGDLKKEEEIFIMRKLHGFRDKQLFFSIPNEKNSQYQHSSLCPQTTIMKIQVQMMNNHKKNPPVLRV